MGAAERVLAEVDALVPELLESVQAAVRIASIEPKYPGQDYDALVGRESEVARLVAAVYEQAGAEVEVFAVEEGRDNACGVVRGAGGGRSLLYNGHIDVVPPGNPELWTDDPFSGERRDGRILGPRLHRHEGRGPGAGLRRGGAAARRRAAGRAT